MSGSEFKIKGHQRARPVRPYDRPEVSLLCLSVMLSQPIVLLAFKGDCHGALCRVVRLQLVCELKFEG